MLFLKDNMTPTVTNIHPDPSIPILDDSDDHSELDDLTDEHDHENEGEGLNNNHNVQNKTPQYRKHSS